MDDMKMRKGILSDIIKEMSGIEAGDWKGKKNAAMTITITQPEGAEAAEDEAAEVCPDCNETPCTCEK
jgi:hypothetical protein